MTRYFLHLAYDGTLDLVALGSTSISGLDGYHEVLPPVRFGYARPDQMPVAQ